MRMKVTEKRRRGDERREEEKTRNAGDGEMGGHKKTGVNWEVEKKKGQEK